MSIIEAARELVRAVDDWMCLPDQGSARIQDAHALLANALHDHDEIEQRRPRGLYEKYEVRRTSSWDRVTGCFVLRPSKDLSALRSLRTYATSARTEGLSALADDLDDWIVRIEKTGDPKSANES